MLGHDLSIRRQRPRGDARPDLAATIRRLGLGMLFAALIASCGGGVDSGGTGAPSTSFASGPITGFGSVIVNDVHFDASGATVTDGDGNAHAQSDLRIGMTTDVRGSAISVDADGASVSTATGIVFSSEIVGPISANSLSARTLTVLGQTIDIATTTAFDASLVGGQAALGVGDVAEVYGRFDAATVRYAATRIERRSPVAADRLRGIVSGLDTSARTFSIGATRISYAGVSNLPSTLANGRFVRVAFTLVPSGQVWNAIAIVDATEMIEDRDEVKIKGLVSAFTSSTQFSVNGTAVDARAAQFQNGSSGLALGARVEVEGATVSGVLVATRVTLITDGDEAGESFEVRDVITSLDTVALTFVAHGVVVSYSGTVDFRDGSAADLAVGRMVEARGTLSPDGTKLQASRITFRN